MHWVLIILVSSGWGYAMSNAAFATEDTCKTAGDRAIKDLNSWGSNIRYICVQQ